MNHFESFWIILNVFESFWIIMNVFESFWIILNDLECSGSFLWENWTIRIVQIRSVTFFTKSRNLKGPGYVLMCKWIINAWNALENDYIVQSFKYCGISSSLIADYHSPLMKILTDAELPPNTTVELRVEGDEHMDIFLTDEKEQEQEVIVVRIVE